MCVIVTTAVCPSVSICYISPRFVSTTFIFLPLTRQYALEIGLGLPNGNLSYKWHRFFYLSDEQSIVVNSITTIKISNWPHSMVLNQPADSRWTVCHTFMSVPLLKHSSLICNYYKFLIRKTLMDDFANEGFLISMDSLIRCKRGIYRVAQNKPDYSNFQPSLWKFA